MPWLRWSWMVDVGGGEGSCGGELEVEALDI